LYTQTECVTLVVNSVTALLNVAMVTTMVTTMVITMVIIMVTVIVATNSKVLATFLLAQLFAIAILVVPLPHVVHALRTKLVVHANADNHSLLKLLV
jgi:hypothetical protein